MLGQTSDKIHFLDTGHSDCIILESDGRFAMIDAAEDSDFPADKPHLNLQGYEEKVVDYLLNNCRGRDGKVTLDFVVATHAHSDHIGGFDTVIMHPEISVKKAYLKEYNADKVFIMERMRWDNQEVYDQMVNAIKARNVEWIKEFDHSKETLGNFSVTFFNGSPRKRSLKYGENINSVVTLVEKKDTRVLLAGDLNYKDGDERRIAKEIGKVDLLKVGHHGYYGSTSLFWAKTLSPKYAVITNTQNRIYPDVRFKLEKIAHSELHFTADEKGVTAYIGSNGDINMRSGMISTSFSSGRPMPLGGKGLAYAVK